MKNTIRRRSRYSEILSLSARNAFRRTLAVAILAATGLSACAVAQESGTSNTNSQPTANAKPSGTSAATRSQPEIANRFDKAKQRYVHATSAVVRCGPAEEYYATDKLDKGAQVDVYLETANGWSGIRPSNRSHNWIPSDAVYILPGGKSAEVIVDTTPAWVGSDLEKIEHFLWQTELVKTQQVLIIGEAYQGTGENRKLWLRIAPPQGEFRWVRTNQLSDVAPRTTPIPTGIQPIERPTSDMQPTDSLAKTANTDNAVQLAQYSEPTSANEPPPKIVWSDENEQIAKIEAQIRSEQNEIKNQMAEQGVHVAVDSPEILDSEPESLLTSDSGVVSGSSSTRKARTIKPIPRSSSAKGKTYKKSTAHATDAQHWQAMQSSNDPKLKVGPMSSVLGMIGLSVVEADRIPQNAKIARQYNEQQYIGGQGSDLGKIGPIGGNRLDRLPRPTRRSPGSYYSYNDTPSSSNSPALGSGVEGQFANAGNTFSKWLQSNEPVFGGSNNATYPTATPSDSSFANASPLGTNQGWYGINNTTTAVHRDNLNGAVTASSAAFSQPASPTPNSPQFNPSDDDREFTTPEIQNALLDLTDIVSLPTEKWNFVDLHRQATHWIENGSDALVRGEARLLKERIERFEAVRQKSLGIAPAQSFIQTPNANIGSNVNPIANPQLNPIPGSGQLNSPTATFPTTGNLTTQPGDASGWLVQVHTSVPGQPEFALTDDAGNVIVYVQPTAGLNLRRYLQQPVSIQGVRGYLPTLAAKQILAERVVRIR